MLICQFAFHLVNIYVREKKEKQGNQEEMEVQVLRYYKYVRLFKWRFLVSGSTHLYLSIKHQWSYWVHKCLLCVLFLVGLSKMIKIIQTRPVSFILITPQYRLSLFVIYHLHHHHCHSFVTVCFNYLLLLLLLLCFSSFAVRTVQGSEKSPVSLGAAGSFHLISRQHFL